jgi:hypothetical protein
MKNEGGRSRLSEKKLTSQLLKYISELPSPFHQFELLVALASA